MKDCELMAQSRMTAPDRAERWTLYVSDQSVEENRDWSQPVQFKFERLEDGRVEMWLRWYEPKS